MTDERVASTPDHLENDDRLVGADRVVAVLIELAKHPHGVSLDELAGIVRSTKPTVHRALATLRRAGLAHLTSRGIYVLGDEYLRLAFRNLEGRPETARMQPLLEHLAAEFGETAHYAVLQGGDIVYRAKMDPPQGAVKLTSVVGGRNPAYRTAVGKALLSTMLTDRDKALAWFGDRPFEHKTPNTLMSVDALLLDLEITRSRGFAIDDQENEIGINCVAIPVYLEGSGAATGAVSVSAVSFRCDVDELISAVPRVRDAVAAHLGPHALGP